jgi:1-acyl-sn-glycerol-3-phosphate acyltransferase
MRDERTWIWTIAAPIVRALIGLVFRVRVEGAGHIPRMGPAIIAPNHLSVLDGPVLSAITGVQARRATRNLVAAEVFHGPIGWVLRQAVQIPIVRGTGDTGALDAALVAIGEGTVVGIFPEGRVNGDGDGVQRIRSGLTRVALPRGAPVIPVGMWGTQHLWPKAGLDRRALFRRPRLGVVYGTPLLPRTDETPSGFRERYREALVEYVARARSLADR